MTHEVVKRISELPKQLRECYDFENAGVDYKHWNILLEAADCIEKLELEVANRDNAIIALIDDDTDKEVKN